MYGEVQLVAQQLQRCWSVSSTKTDNRRPIRLTYSQLVPASTGRMIRLGHDRYFLPQIFSTYIHPRTRHQHTERRVIPFAACNCLSTEQENLSLPRNRILNRSSSGRLVKLRRCALCHAVWANPLRHRVQGHVVIGIHGGRQRSIAPYMSTLRDVTQTITSHR